MSTASHAKKMQRLPNELVFEIVANLDASVCLDRRTLEHLRLVSRATNFVATPLLFRGRVLSLGGCREESFRRLAGIVKRRDLLGLFDGLALRANDLVLSSFWEQDASQESLWMVLPQISDQYFRSILDVLDASKGRITKLVVRLSVENEKPDEPSSITSIPDGKTSKRSKTKYAVFKSQERAIRSAKTRLLVKSQMVTFCFSRVISQLFREQRVLNVIDNLRVVAREDDLVDLLLLRPPKITGTSVFRGEELDWSNHSADMYLDWHGEASNVQPPLYNKLKYFSLESLSQRLSSQSGSRNYVALHGFFLCHGQRLANVEELRIDITKAHRTATHKNFRTSFDALGLRLSTLKSLRSLKLSSEDLYVVSPLMGLLQTCCATVDTLELKNMRIGMGTWSALFEQLVDRRLPSLLNLRLEGLRYNWGDEEYEGEVEEEVPPPPDAGFLAKWPGYGRPLLSPFFSDFTAFHGMREELIRRRMELGLPKDQWLEVYCGSEEVKRWMGQFDAIDGRNESMLLRTRELSYSP